MTDYEKEYRKGQHILGQPTKDFVDFFETLSTDQAMHVLDVGCGQGRDALFIARKGHRVVAIDLSPTGIQQLSDDAATENLNIVAEVADVIGYHPSEMFDVVVIDRTLHMLDAESRTNVVAAIVPCVKTLGYLLIADERSNMPAIKESLFALAEWRFVKEAKGLLFVQRASI